MFRWFKKSGQPPEGAGDQLPDEMEQHGAPPGEKESLLEIRYLCRIAETSAERIAEAKEHDGVNEEMLQYEFDRYTQVRAEAVHLADTITDEFYRGMAIRFLIDLCMKAGDIDDARSLFKYQEIEVIRERIVEEYPDIARPRISVEYQ
jgi:hypothetical protein